MVRTRPASMSDVTGIDIFDRKPYAPVVVMEVSW